MPTIPIQDLASWVGREVGVSAWTLVDQERIDRFADITEDWQFIHVDPDAASRSPYGAPIAHGFLVLSLLSKFAYEVALGIEGAAMGVNYGFNRVRYLSPVKSGSKVRGRFKLRSVADKTPTSLLLTYEVQVEVDGDPKPALVAEWVTMQQFNAALPPVAIISPERPLGPTPNGSMAARDLHLVTHLFSPAGKIAVVTGGSRGIGAMIARGFVEAGVRTYITARNSQECTDTARELSAFGECVALPCDLSNMDGIAALVETFRSRETKLDILVNNAGTAWGAPFSNYPESGWDKVFDLNIKSLFFITQQLFPFLRAAGNADDPARVINIASMNGLTNPHANNYAYAASKAGVIHLTRHLASDLAKDHVNVNALAPGYFPSKMTAHLSSQFDDIAHAIPRGRLGTPDDAAGAALFLAARASAWITGVTIPVDGGMVANA